MFLSLSFFSTESTVKNFFNQSISSRRMHVSVSRRSTVPPRGGVDQPPESLLFAVSSNNTKQLDDSGDSSGLCNAAPLTAKSPTITFQVSSASIRVFLAMLFVIGISLVISSTHTGSDQMELQSADFRGLIHARHSTNTLLHPAADVTATTADGNKAASVQRPIRRVVRAVSCGIEAAFGAFHSVLHNLRRTISSHGGYVYRESSGSSVRVTVLPEADDEMLSKLTTRQSGTPINSIYPFHRLGSGQLVAKIPSDRLDAFVGDLGRFSPGARITKVDRSSHEVTAAYSNTETLLKVAKSELLQYQSLYDSLTSVGEKVAMLQQLMHYEREVQLREREIKSLQRAVDFATVTVSVTEAPLDLKLWIPELFESHQGWMSRIVSKLLHRFLPNPNLASWIGGSMKILGIVLGVHAAWCSMPSIASALQKWMKHHHPSVVVTSSGLSPGEREMKLVPEK